MSANVLLISVEAVKQRTGVHLNLDDKLIVPEIKAAQDQHIKEALGGRLFRRLQDAIAAASLTGDEAILLDEYVTDALAWYVVAALPMSGSFQFFTKGTLRKTSENAELPSMSDLSDLSGFYTKRADYYREALIRYISLNRSLYPLYGRDDDGSRPLKSGYSLPFALPDDDDDC